MTLKHVVIIFGGRGYSSFRLTRLFIQVRRRTRRKKKELQINGEQQTNTRRIKGKNGVGQKEPNMDYQQPMSQKLSDNSKDWQKI